MSLSSITPPIEGIRERTEYILIYFFFPPSLNRVLFPMFCLLVEGSVRFQCSKILLVTFSKYTKRMSTYSNRLQPAFQNLLQRVVRFFHPRSSCTTTHISADVQGITLNVSRMTISGERTEQFDIFCRVTGFTNDFLSFIDVEIIRFFHGALQLF